jgi:two-component system, chemotaxis family, sensor kinase CheA
MLQALLQRIVLPRQISEFERSYLRRMNKIGLLFFALHVPVFVVIAYFNDTGPLLAGLLGLAALAGPALAFVSFENPRSVSMTYGFASMLMGGVLVHVGQGPVQIEMHFYFFALLAMLAVYGNPLVILVAALTVALHHLALWMVLPKSVFNYDAPIWVVLVHAAFVVLESVATCYIARSFFDNVIGLEKIVQARTTELDARNRDMRLVLDNVGQGFLTIDRAGRMSSEQSAIVETWLGAADPGCTFAHYLGRKASVAGETFELGLEAVIDGFLPLDVTLDQLPRRFGIGTQTFSMQYKPIPASADFEKILIVITDVTAAVERERLEFEQREMVQIFDRLIQDRSGFMEFFEETRELVKRIASGAEIELTVLKRLIHTLKGNSAIFAITSLSDKCHELETWIDETGARPTEEQIGELSSSFERLRSNVDTLRGKNARPTVEVEKSEYDAVLGALLRNEPSAKLARRIANWWLEPTSRRLARISEQAQRIATRLGKAPVEVRIRDNGLHLEAARWASFWSSFIHVIRNAVDHGLEPKDERKSSGKQECGLIEISTAVQSNAFVVTIGDDGRGIDWKRIAERAKIKGIPHKTREDLTEAVFTDGISTAAYVSDLSGRGIGMAAVRAECHARGGTVQLHTTEGSGTRVVFSFPIASMAEDRTASYAA